MDGVAPERLDGRPQQADPVDEILLATRGIPTCQSTGVKGRPCWSTATRSGRVAKYAGSQQMFRQAI